MMLFSVIVPIYKTEEYLPQCVESILAQTYDDFEVILVDDGSPDGCPQLCDYYASLDARVHVIHQENGGSTSARLAGAMLAKGDYIITVDSDDYIDKILLETVFRKIQQDPCDVILFNAMSFSEAGMISTRHEVSSGVYYGEELGTLRDAFMFDKNKRTLNFGNILFALWSKAIKTSLFLKYQSKVPTAVRKGDDLAVFAPILYACESLMVLTESYYYYRINPNSMMRSYSDKDVHSLVSLYEYLLPYCQESYKLNLERCLIQMMLEHIMGIARCSSGYMDFREGIRKLFCSPLLEMVQKHSITGLRLIDKLKLISLKRSSWLLYQYYR